MTLGRLLVYIIALIWLGGFIYGVIHYWPSDPPPATETQQVPDNMAQAPVDLSDPTTRKQWAIHKEKVHRLIQQAITQKQLQPGSPEAVRELQRILDENPFNPGVEKKS